MNNQRVRFTTSENSVLVKTTVKTTGPTTSRVLDTDKGPLQLLRFSKRKTDAQLAWGKAVSGLAVAVTPTDKKGKVLVRWKNVGKGLFEVPWLRHTGNRFGSHGDDLLGHVVLKGPDGKSVPARKNPPRAGGPHDIPRNFVLGPGQIHEEILDLWDYVERPAAAGKYQLEIELDIPAGRHRWEVEARLWTGKVHTNELTISLNK